MIHPCLSGFHSFLERQTLTSLVKSSLPSAPRQRRTGPASLSSRTTSSSSRTPGPPCGTSSLPLGTTCWTSWARWSPSAPPGGSMQRTPSATPTFQTSPPPPEERTFPSLPAFSRPKRRLRNQESREKFSTRRAIRLPKNWCFKRTCDPMMLC